MYKKILLVIIFSSCTTFPNKGSRTIASKEESGLSCTQLFKSYFNLKKNISRAKNQFQRDLITKLNENDYFKEDWYKWALQVENIYQYKAFDLMLSFEYQPNILTQLMLKHPGGYKNFELALFVSDEVTLHNLKEAIKNNDEVTLYQYWKSININKVDALLSDISDSKSNQWLLTNTQTRILDRLIKRYKNDKDILMRAFFISKNESFKLEEGRTLIDSELYDYPDKLVLKIKEISVDRKKLWPGENPESTSLEFSKIFLSIYYAAVKRAFDDESIKKIEIRADDVVNKKLQLLLRRVGFIEASQSPRKRGKSYIYPLQRRY